MIGWLAINNIVTAILSIALCNVPLAFPKQISQSGHVGGHKVLRIYSEKQGGQNTTFAQVIFQDGSGAYWIGGWHGVSRYDERQGRWQGFPDDPGGRVGKDVSMIGESKGNKLWFAASLMWAVPGPDLRILDGNNWQRIDDRSDHAVLISSITAMFQGRDGKLWFGTGNSLTACDGQNWTSPLEVSKEININRPLIIRAGYQDSTMCLWLGTTKGVVRFDVSKNEWRTYPELNNSFVNCLYEDQLGRIWAADSEGRVYVRNKTKDNWATYNLLEHLPSNLVRSLPTAPSRKPLFTVRGMCRDRSGRMFFPTRAGLLTFVESEEKWELLTSINSALPDNHITTIFEDRIGRIWIGTGKGIVVLEP